MFDIAIPFPDISPFVFSVPAFKLGGMEIGPLGLRWYALAYIAGIVLGWRMMLGMTARPALWGGASPLTREDVDDFVFYATLGVLLGGRLGYVLLYRPDLLADPVSVLRIWEGGMSFHGGFAGVCVAVVATALLRKISLWNLADAVALVAPIGLFFGRLANFVNQELWGRPADVPWAFVFSTDPLGLARHPSQLYQAALEGLLVFLVLRLLATRFSILARPGLAAGLFMMFYAVARTIGELFREPDAELILGLTRGQAYSLPMLLAGMILAGLAMRRRAGGDAASG